MIHSSPSWMMPSGAMCTRPAALTVVTMVSRIIGMDSSFRTLPAVCARPPSGECDPRPQRRFRRRDRRCGRGSHSPEGGRAHTAGKVRKLESMPMIRETIVTTVSAAGLVHIAPLGIIQDGEEWIIAPFRPSTTLDNLRAVPFAVANYTDDVRVF